VQSLVGGAGAGGKNGHKNQNNDSFGVHMHLFFFRESTTQSSFTPKKRGIPCEMPLAKFSKTQLLNHPTNHFGTVSGFNADEV
jgi:hypothetical protein